MKWIFVLLILVCMQVRAEQVPLSAANDAPQATEISVAAPGSNSVGSSTTEESLKGLKETEIPVHLEAVKKADGNESPVLKVIASFCILGILGCAAYYALRKYKFTNPKAQATQIKVLSQHYLGPKKSLAIVRVAGESVLIGITDHNISMIKSLSLLDEDIPEETPKDFTSIFAKKTKADAAPVDEADSNESKDDFSISGIKDFVSVKLKNMRSLE